MPPAWKNTPVLPGAVPSVSAARLVTKPPSTVIVPEPPFVPTTTPAPKLAIFRLPPATVKRLAPLEPMKTPPLLIAATPVKVTDG